MIRLEEQFDESKVLNRVIVPDLWQHKAISELRKGKDVVVHAPTGAGKTLIFELWSNYGKNHDQAIYTVPTRALANDKMAEWRAQGWDVGITTGDLSENLNAPVVVATLETQKRTLLRGKGPALLVVDEYQMLGDPGRGLNYELALSMAPPNTQLLLLSGSVVNPHHVVDWLRRLGRDAEMIRHEFRPVPLEEVFVDRLSSRTPRGMRGYWSRLIVKALAEDLGPILLFAPHRQSAVSIASELARSLPNVNPLILSEAQRRLVGDNLTRMLNNRVAFHHSGLSYASRAGVIEPLAKAGQLRVVVATMGLAAGINFSLRSVALAGDSYRRGNIEHPLRADEILQMFGRAGRRGIDETGYIIITANRIRLREAYPCQLSRNGQVDWGALLGIMDAAVDLRKSPFAEAVRTQSRLFSAKPIVLGIEESLNHPDTPCALKTDSERARFVRKKCKRILNSRGFWQDYPKPVQKKLKEVKVPSYTSVKPAGNADSSNARETEKIEVSLQSALSKPEVLKKVGVGELAVLKDSPKECLYGKEFKVADVLADGGLVLVKWVRKMIKWRGRRITRRTWNKQTLMLLEKRLRQNYMPLVGLLEANMKMTALVSLAELKVPACVDDFGVPLWKPKQSFVAPPKCRDCRLIQTCRELSPATGVALLWKRLGLVDEYGIPGRRGRIISFFNQNHGLAIAAAIEDESYHLEDLIYDLANLEAGFRFSRDEYRWGGRLALACRKLYNRLSIPGYLEDGVPPDYGAGAEEVIASVHSNPANKHYWITDYTSAGDIDRVIIEWRSLLRQIAHAPDIPWQRWTEFKNLANTVLHETDSPTITDLPPLEYNQLKRVDHRLTIKRS
ncbi:MAG: DEAD/DEAH box helicase [Verrucomicrobia bacterium]|nr:DEAD/DEAH box helicase [Verrucomicrobiota bacterium]MCF7708404.1 DEAD/DEAH box helicase [Verrucomicrobiota bacterium]